MKRLSMLLCACLLASACATARAGDDSGGRIRVATTVNFITDLAMQVGGEHVAVTGLMGPGVDPHLYKASAGDVTTLQEADLILYAGLELEGKLTELLDALAAERPTVAVTADLPREQLIQSANFAGEHDPHVWFDVAKWQTATGTVANALAEADPANAETYRRRAADYVAQLASLDAELAQRIDQVPERSRVLITSHDAFGYLGRRYGFEVVAVQGVSTTTQATATDVERVAGVIAERGVRTVFVESSVPRQTIDAVVAAAAARGQPTRVGAALFTDAAGAPGTPEATYVGMLRHNVDQIVEGLR